VSHADTIRSAIFHSRWYVRGSDAHPTNCKGCTAETALRALVAENQEQAEDIAEYRQALDDTEYLIAEYQQLRDALLYIAGFDVAGYDAHLQPTDVARAALDGTEDGPPRAENREAVQPTKGMGSS
jgi:hypothetical protein